MTIFAAEGVKKRLFSGVRSVVFVVERMAEKRAGDIALRWGAMAGSSARVSVAHMPSARRLAVNAPPSPAAHRQVHTECVPRLAQPAGVDWGALVPAENLESWKPGPSNVCAVLRRRGRVCYGGRGGQWRGLGSDAMQYTSVMVTV